MTISVKAGNHDQAKLLAGALAHRALLDVRGPDAAALLQGQLCSDVRAVSEARCGFTGLNSPKGRLLATAFLHRLGPEHYALDLPASIVEATLARLKLFVLRSKVTLSARPAGDGLFGLIGEEAPQALAAAGLPLPEAPFTAAAAGAGFVVRRPAPSPRFVLIDVEPPAFEGLLPLPASAWVAADLKAGIANIHPATRDAFVAPTAGLEAHGAIGYEKGCYTGQEVIARLHYLGQAKRALALLAVEAELPPGEPVLEGEATVGEVVEAAEGLALAVMLRTAADTGLRSGPGAARRLMFF